MAGLTAFLFSSQNLPSTGQQCIFLSMFIFHMSFYTVAVKSPFTLVFMSPCFSLIFHRNSVTITLQFDLTVPQQLMAFICKWSVKSGEGKKLCIYSLCPKCSILIVSSVTVARVAVIVAVAHFLSLPKYTDMLCVYPLKSHNL
jgi:hypothetical protein